MTAVRPGLPLLAAALAAALALVAGPARGSTSQEVTIAAADGTQLAATLALPDGAAPAGGWPAIVLLHVIGGSRAQGLAIADAMGLAQDYAVLAFDARGHGTSGGTVGLDGPAEVADARAVYEWLRDRPDVDDARIGAFGVSYGGAAVLGSLVAGVPWAAAEVAISFADLTRALYPQGLAKSGVIGGFVASLDPARVDPEVIAARDAAFRGDTAVVTAFGAARSSLPRLGGVRAPVYVMQGRRDLAFDLDQGLAAYRALGGPKRLWVGNVGHVVSSFPGPDTSAMLADGRRWFDRFLLDRRNGIDTGPPVTIAGEGSRRTTALAALPPTSSLRRALPQAATLARPSARASWRFAPTGKALEVFGAPAVVVRATAAAGWSRLVAVLTATAKGSTRLVAVGGVPLRPGSATVTVRLTATATLIPAGARLTLTLGSSSATAPGKAALAYLDLPLPDTARVTLRGVSLALPVLKTPLAR